MLVSSGAIYRTTGIYVTVDNKALGNSKEYDDTTKGRNKTKNRSYARDKIQTLSRLMGEASCLNFIGRAWSGAQYMR